MNLTDPSVSLVNQHTLRATVFLSEDSPLPLQEFCERLSTILDLPSFVYDAENDDQWGFVQLEQGCVEINISRPHNQGRSGLVSYTISLLVSEAASSQLDKNWLNQILVPAVSSGLELL